MGRAESNDCDDEGRRGALIVDANLALGVGAIVRIGNDDWGTSEGRESDIWKAFVLTGSEKQFVLASVVDAQPVPRVSCEYTKRTNGHGIEIRLYFNEKVKEFLARIAVVQAGATQYSGPFPTSPARSSPATGTPAGKTHTLP